MPKLLGFYSLRGLLLLSVITAAVRWVIIAFCVKSLLMLVIAQLLHAVAFGVHHVAVLQLIHRYFVGRHQGRGQALYSSLAYGLGGALGALVSGYAWSAVDATSTFILAAITCTAAFLIAWRWLERDVSM